MKQRLVESAAPRLSGHELAHLVEAASICDGIVKGLRHPQWPVDAWAALQRLVLMTMEPLRAPARAPVRARG
jgi:DNA polymerase-3 subunit delta